ncbi:hypothetical protein F52700_4836 [Fusarium sp. NRRL 52700]|nr:hypothetical protein F52700_4836 [Fusarium sp. NRRL 52700]
MRPHLADGLTFKGIRPIPIFPWRYIGGAPRGRYLDTWKNNTRELQKTILQRLGPLRPNSWKRNKKHRSIKALFSIEDILRNSQPAIKSELEDEDCMDQLPDTISVPREQWKAEINSIERSSSASLRIMEMSWNQNGGNCSREASPPAADEHGNDNLQAPGNAETLHSSGDPDPWAGDQFPGFSEPWAGNDDHGHLVHHVTPRRRRAPRSPSSAEPVSAISRSLERFAKMSARLHCIEDENFDVDTVAWLVMGLGDDESRRRLYYFYDHAAVDIWFCLGDVVSQPVRHLTELGSSQEACISHGLSCKRVMVVRDELDFRRLRFESVHRDD